MNRFLHSLAKVCGQNLLAEKWVLAPNRRVGHQWIESVVREGQPAVNLHVKTMRAMALEIAAPALIRDGVSLVRSHCAEICLTAAWQRCRETVKHHYLLSLNPSRSLLQTLSRTIDAVRLAGVEEFKHGAFESEEKIFELQALLTAYQEEVKSCGWVDYASVLRTAMEELRRAPDFFREDQLVLIPEDSNLSRLELDLLEALPENTLQRLPVDHPMTPLEKSEEQTDSAILRWVGNPSDAPEAKNDGTIALFQAVDERNEVREVLRRCLEKGLPLDEIEILHTDREVYLPLIYESMEALRSERKETEDSLGDVRSSNFQERAGVTFQEGIPGTYSRPGRAFLAWYSWMREDFPQSTLVRMVQDGLLVPPAVSDEEVEFPQLVEILRKPTIRFGSRQYLWWIEHPSPDESNSEVLVAVREWLKQLLGISTGLDAPPAQLIDSAIEFINRFARRQNELDQYAHKEFLKELEAMQELLKYEEEAVFNAREWLETLPKAARLEGSGPRPGCIHVDHILSGGHSSRKQTFIIGLDDARFPGAGLQDPLLLDAERERISGDLPTARSDLSLKVEAFQYLLSRLRGNVTLSYTNHTLAEDCDRFPTQLFNAAARLFGYADGTTVPITSFVPITEGSCLNSTEWWLHLLGREDPLLDATSAVGQCYPHLGRGLEAARQRESSAFTVYDGKLPEDLVGKERNRIDPTQEEGPSLSASALETVGRCPLKYFFRYVLDLKPLEDISVDPETWLDAATAGELLHSVFQKFFSNILEQGRTPSVERDSPRIAKILEEEVDRYRRRHPPPNESLFMRQVQSLKRTASMFLHDEERFCKTSNPVYLEASIGLAPSEKPTPIDSPDPVAIGLPDGRTLRAKGRIDRVDQTDENVFTLWDYKTGSPSKYSKKDPFQAGRIFQHFVYTSLVESNLRKVLDPKSKVSQFGYFFPSESGRGDRIRWSVSELEEGREILGDIAAILSSGSFLATDKEDDCRYCDYRPICRNIPRVTTSSGQKLANTDNDALEPFRKLRPPK